MRHDNQDFGHKRCLYKGNVPWTKYKGHTLGLFSWQNRFICWLNNERVSAFWFQLVSQKKVFFVDWRISHILWQSDMIRLKFSSQNGLYTFKELIEINVLFSAVGETVADAESVGTETIKT